jgi:predicted DNA-binding ribbon-helix-helix protein
MGKDHTIYVSDSAWTNLAEMAKIRGMSRSALIDAIGRGEIVLGDRVTEVSPNLTTELTAPTVSDNLVSDPTIAAILQPPKEANG